MCINPTIFYLTYSKRFIFPANPQTLDKNMATNLHQIILDRKATVNKK